MNSFTSQLQATRANLERLEALAAAASDLFEHAHCGIYVQDDSVRVIIGDLSKTPEHWRALAWKYRAANWKRDERDNWDGELQGVQLTILRAQPATKTEAVFAESEAA